jgi:hypothetical protein
MSLEAYIPLSSSRAMLPTITRSEYSVNTILKALKARYKALTKSLSDDEILTASVFLFSGHEILVQDFDSVYPDILIVRGILAGDDKAVEAYIDTACLQVVFSKAKKPGQKRHPIGFRMAPETPETQQELPKVKARKARRKG